MRTKILLNFCTIVLLTVLFSASAFGQQARINAFSVERSTLIEQLKQKKAENPNVSTAELATFANALLAEVGFNYEFGLATKICKLIAEKEAKMKPEQRNAIGINIRFNQAQGELVAIKFPDVATQTDACGACSVEFPLLSITDKDFVTIIQGHNIKLQLPPDVISETVELVDNEDLTKIIRRWRLPFQTTPLGVSAEGTILYVDIKLDDLALMIFENGTLEIAAKKDLNLSEKAVYLKDFPNDPKNAYSNFVSFGANAAKRTVRFSSPCT